MPATDKSLLSASETSPANDSPSSNAGIHYLLICDIELVTEY